MPRYFLDPPDGHAYGFPKLFEGDIDALDFDSWLRENGYPDELIQMFPNGRGCRILTRPDADNADS